MTVSYSESQYALTYINVFLFLQNDTIFSQRTGRSSPSFSFNVDKFFCYYVDDSASHA